MRLLVLIVIYFACTASVFSQDAIIDKSQPGCLGVTAKSVTPFFPAQDLKDKRGGTVVVKAWYDVCGRVTRSEVLKSSRNKRLDFAALEAANKSVFEPLKNDTPEDLMFKEIPYTFTVDKKEYKSEKAIWPSSHKSAYFVLDESPLQYKSIEEAMHAIGLKSLRILSLTPIQRLYQIKDEKGDVWLFLADNVTHKTRVAAIYQITTAQAPTISVQVLCDPAIKDCDLMKATLLKNGLPSIAKSMTK
jgi:TonB family protein